MPDWQTPVEAYCTAQITARKFPGASVAIAVDGKLAYAKAFGIADMEKRTPVVPETAFEIASVTKAMTATAILQLRDAGLVDLDSPVQRYLPWFQLADAQAAAAITLRHLLTHTSGIPASAMGVIWRDWEKLSGSALEAAKALAGVVPAHRPGESFEYSNMGYVLLGLVVEAVSEKPWHTYIHEKILSPLKMRQSTADPAHMPLVDIARPHTWRLLSKRPLAARRFGPALAAASSTAACSAGDLARFGMMHLGQHLGVLKPESAAEAHRGTVAMGGQLKYGLGWVESMLAGEHAVWVDGSGEGSSALLVLLPERGMVVAVAANIKASLEPIALGIIEALQGKQPEQRKGLDPVRVRLGYAPLVLDLVAGAVVIWAALFSAMGLNSLAPALCGVVAFAAGLWLLLTHPFAVDLPTRKIGRFFPEMTHGVTSLMLAGVAALLFAGMTLTR